MLCNNYFVSYEILHDFFSFCNNYICCRPLHRSMILSSGSTLRSSLKTRNGCKTVAVGDRGQGDDGEETRRGGCKKEHKEEERRRVAAYREEREKKLERARRAKATMEENPDALRKGKWPRCTQ